MTAQGLHDYLKTVNPAPLLLDVREQWEFDTCHIEGSQLVPMNHVPSAMNELDPDQEIVVICHHGIRSRAVAVYLANNDFGHIINLSGGIDAWAKQVDTKMPTY